MIYFQNILICRHAKIQHSHRGHDGVKQRPQIETLQSLAMSVQFFFPPALVIQLLYAVSLTFLFLYSLYVMHYVIFIFLWLTPFTWHGVSKIRIGSRMYQNHIPLLFRVSPIRLKGSPLHLLLGQSLLVYGLHLVSLEISFSLVYFNCVEGQSSL